MMLLFGVGIDIRIRFRRPLIHAFGDMIEFLRGGERAGKRRTPCLCYHELRAFCCMGLVFNI